MSLVNIMFPSNRIFCFSQNQTTYSVAFLVTAWLVIVIFIKQFRARWPWSIGVLESWLSMSSSSEVPASSILRIPSPRRFVPVCGRQLQDSNTPIDHGHLARDCLIKITMLAVKASVVSWLVIVGGFGYCEKQCKILLTS